MILPEVLIQDFNIKGLEKLEQNKDFFYWVIIHVSVLKKALLPCCSNVTVSPQALVMRIIKRIVNKGICCSDAPSNADYASNPPHSDPNHTERVSGNPNLRCIRIILLSITFLM